MRLIGSFEHEKHARVFSLFLTKEGIENQCEIDVNTDWGSADYGKRFCTVWISNEDRVDDAKKYYDEFKANPDNPRFTQQDVITHIPKRTLLATPRPSSRKDLRRSLVQGTGIITLYLLFACCLLFIWTVTNETPISEPPSFLPPSVLMTSTTKKMFLYDYPEAYYLADKLLLVYEADKLKGSGELSPDGQALLQQFQNTPYWQGIYEEFVKQGGNPLHFKWTYQGPMFERIQAGEWWRLFTPIFLHGDIFHLLFNMIWLLVLGQQLERRLGKWRYVAFIAIAAAVSNTAQYLMSGPNFLGFSGVVCAMLAFIWVRQRIAPWEGYLLHSSTIVFIVVFVLSLLVLQLVSFYFEMWHQVSFTPGIANTAHVAGAIAGLILGRFRLFAVK